MIKPARSGPRHNARVRCAIYTRKSTEEGLDQQFNSLQARREACEAFINSQRHEGWVCLRAAYDDGGFSGATMLSRDLLIRALARISHTGLGFEAQLRQLHAEIVSVAARNLRESWRAQ